MQSESIHARYVFEVAGPPLRDVSLTIAASQQMPINFGSVAIVPGLFNAHTHLELSDCEAPLGDPSRGFPAWIRQVIQWRKSQSGSITARQQAVGRGLDESRAAGVTGLFDIASPCWQPEWYANSTETAIFQEVLGLSTAREDELFAQAKEAANNAVWVSPHAPYTVGIDLLARLATLGVPLAMHLAESLDELELLRSHSGAFYGLLTELDAWDPAAIPRGVSILDYLQVLAKAPSALVIHGNYLSEEEIGFLAANKQMTVVYCPRTHAYFGHPRYPLVEMLAAGVSVRLGTDSRASNPDLNLWNDLRYVADAFPELSLETIFALGVSSWPTLPRNDSFVVVEIPEEEPADPYELLFDPRSHVAAVFHDGRQVWPPWGTFPTCH